MFFEKNRELIQFTKAHSIIEKKLNACKIICRSFLMNKIIVLIFIGNIFLKSMRKK